MQGFATGIKLVDLLNSAVEPFGLHRQRFPSSSTTQKIGVRAVTLFSILKNSLSRLGGESASVSLKPKVLSAGRR